MDRRRKTQHTLRGKLLRSAVIKGADLKGMDLANASLEGANLEKSNLANADLTLAKAYRASFIKVIAPDARFVEANLGEADFSHATLERADFRDAFLVDARFDHAVLIGATFDGATMKGASFKGAILKDVSMRGTDLPSPLELLRASWCHVRDEALIRDLMRLDASAHPNPKAFDRWAANPENALCPYSGSGTQRCVYFSERPELWSPGDPPRLWDLLMRLFEAANISWSPPALKHA